MMRRWTLATKKAAYQRLETAARHGHLQAEAEAVAREHGLRPEEVIALYTRLRRVLAGNWR